MSKDNRARPRIHRTDDKHDKALRAYAAEHGIEPWKALETAIERIVSVAEAREASAITAELIEAQHNVRTLRAAVTRAENVALTREIQRDDAIADCAAERKAHTATRADLESAREATRRADAEVERITADWRAALAETERVKALALERAGADATEIKRLREQYEAALDAVPSVAESRADQATIAALRSELAEVRAALATKGATDRLAERAETIAADVDRRACACALPDDLAPRLAAIAARRDVEPHVMLANVIKNGISKIEASDKYQDAQKAARARS